MTGPRSRGITLSAGWLVFSLLGYLCFLALAASTQNQGLGAIAVLGLAVWVWQLATRRKRLSQQPTDNEAGNRESVDQRPTTFVVKYVVACWAFFVLFAVLTVSSQGISRIFAAVAAICGLVAAIILTLATRRLVSSGTVSDGRPPPNLPS